MLELVYQDHGKDTVFPLDKAEVVIGRSPKADVSVSDYGVSRFHAKLIVNGDEVMVQDLESRNGTKVNDVQVLQARIVPGDRITLGNFSLQLRQPGVTEDRLQDAVSVRGGEIEADSDLAEVGGTIIRSHGELERLLAGAPSAAGEGRAPAIDEIERSNRILRMLTQVAKALISEESLDGLLNKVIDLVFENISCERGCLGLYEGDELSFKVVRYRKPREGADKITIPRTITNRVRRDKVSILTMDAQQDERFDSSASIFMLGIRSAMCVPLWDKGEVVGIIYVDEDIRAGTFNTNDLDLLSALGNYAAVAIERARLSAKIKEEQATRARLERYHSPGVVEMILAGVGSLDELEMHERVVTVSFTDIVGFTSLSERLEPREVGQAINEYFTELTECIFKYEGTLDKYIGDCIMAVFGAPIPQPDHAVRCVRAVLEMYQVLAKLNAEHPDVQFQLRTGLNSGKVVAGDIGSPKRKDYTVLGDTVNLASRLESSVAKPGWIVIGEETYEEVKDFFLVESLGSFAVKGKKREVGAFRVLGEKPGAFGA